MKKKFVLFLTHAYELEGSKKEVEAIRKFAKKKDYILSADFVEVKSDVS